jgi:phosphopentomutase
MPRAFLVVMDSVGIGGAPDADSFFNNGRPDTGANTLGHIADACAEGRADEGRSGPLHLPNLDALGLGAALNLASGHAGPGLGATPTGLWGAATEVSRGKDTPSGHWEIAGVPLPWEWTYFPDTNPAFPDDLTKALAKAAGTEGILGNKHASGTVILDELGGEHMRTGWRAVAPMVHDMRVGRVIARPFLGSEEDGFKRTLNRKDFALDPPSPTLCDWATAAGRPVHAVGKIGDIFAHRGISDEVKGADADLMEGLIRLADTAADGALVFANFVEFDANFGHRRDVPGYAAALEWFDAQLPRFFAKLRDGDLVIFTADHGNDPSWSGTDHTRERVPVLGHGVGLKPIGHVGFSDIGASVAAHLGLAERGAGRSFL